MDRQDLLHTRCTVTTEGGLLQLTGELDTSTAPLVERALAECLSRGVRRLHVDMAGIVFCDSAGLRALENGHRAASSLGVTLRLTGVHPRLRRMLALYGPRHLLPPVAEVIRLRSEGQLRDTARPGRVAASR